MQAASLLPHWNTYEARALRVVISDLPALVPDTPTVSLKSSSRDDRRDPPKGKVTFNLRHFVDFKRRIEGPDGQPLNSWAAESEPAISTLRSPHRANETSERINWLQVRHSPLTA